MLRIPRMNLAAVTIAILVLSTAGASRAAEAPAVRGLQTQQVGGVTYFRAWFAQPGNMEICRVEAGPSTALQLAKLARQPRLVPQDSQTSAVYQRLAIPHALPAVGFDPPPRDPVPAAALDFVGKAHGSGLAKFVLLYPTGQADPAGTKASGAELAAAALLKHSPYWTEVPVELDFAGAGKVALPGSRDKRQAPQPPMRDDLEGLWAEAQAARFAVLEALTPEFGFYGFACAATGRKYGVAAPYLGAEKRDPELLYRRLYETTTGAAALTESLQLQRMLHPTPGDRGRRTVDIWSVPGIDIAEHPWARMMGGKKPSLEALAHLVPRDNFYVHFKNIRKFIEFGELLDQWGTNVSRAYELNSRDYQLKERYERQLCLKSTWLGKTLGPAVVRSLALTGSDGYLREGSDLTVLFHVTSKPLFLAAVEPFLQDARRQFAGRLTESRTDYHGITVESFVTPLREVSLHRAALGDFILYANSPTGLRRVLDAHHGRISALADSLDFQYMRTAFPLDDKQEDGFAFFSDAFIRQLVGPASKIKEKRRLEALTSLAMLTHGALFSAWETGRLPADHPALLDASSLKPSDLYTPEGKGVMWDASQQAAVSDVYNTLHFATPLIELPIDKITPAEQQEYNEFRTAYLNLWRQFFDPVGMRFSINDWQVKLETYILPLISDSRYSTLRSWVGGGTAAFDPATISPKTLLHFAVSTSPAVHEDWLGDHAILRLDDDATIGKLVDYWMQRQIAASPANDAEDAREAVRLALQLPLTAGVRIRDRAKFNAFFETIQITLNSWAPYTATRLKPEYKGIPITRVEFKPGNMIADELRLKRLPNLYHAVIDGWWYVSLREAPLKELIDRAVAKRAGKESVSAAVPINFSVHASPKAAGEARQTLHYYLEWETHRRALVNCPAWLTLYRSGLISSEAPETAKQAAAMRFLAFVPVSPDGATYAYAPEADEVVNRRHGSLRKPRLQPRIEDASPLGRLLEQFRSLRADLRFREDGVHTTVTIERKAE